MDNDLAGNFLKYLSHQKRLSSNTLLSYKKDIDQFQVFIRKQYELNKLDQVSQPHIRDWMVALVESGLSTASVNRKIASLKSLYKYLLNQDIVRDNPTVSLKTMKREKPLPSFLIEDEMIKVLDKIPFETGFKGKTDQLILELLYGTGIRLNEIINLKEVDIDYFSNMLKVLGKGNKERIIPFGGSLKDLIQKYVKMKRETGILNTYLLTTEKGMKLYPMYIYRKVKYYLGLVTTQTKRSPHVIRHTFATHLLNKGADLSAIKDLLGHESLAATQVYTHSSFEKLKAIHEKAHPKA